MDFLDPKKRKQHRLKLFIGYGLMGLTIAMATILLLYQSFGYHRDPKTGEIVQNGFVYVDAQPVSAEVLLDGVSKGRTDQRLDIPAGEYNLELRAQGYRTWKRTFTLDGRSIERFVYPFLFPENPKTSETQLYASAPGLVTESLDRHWMLIQQPGSFQSFDLVDMNPDVPVTSSFSLAPDLLTRTGPTHTLQVVEWSSDNKHVVLKHSFEGGQEFVVVNIESPGASVNLTQVIKAPFTTLALRDKKFDQYYLFNEPAKTLQTASINNPVPAAYLTDVLAFRPHGDDVMAYVTAAGASAGKVFIKAREGQDVYTIREVTAGSGYLLDVARFENNWYYAGGTIEDQRVYIFKNPVAAVKSEASRRPVPVAVLRTTSAPKFLSFSANARFIAVQATDEFSVYDAENDRQYRYDTELGLTADQKALWMDGHRLSVAAGDKSVIFDYDSTNKQTLTSAFNNYPIIFDRDYKAFYALAPSVVPGRPAIVRTSLRVQT